METPMVIQLLWIQLMNETLQRCGLQENAALQDLNDTILTTRCLIDSTFTLERNYTVLEEVEEEKDKLIEELRGQLLLRKEMLRLSGDIISSLQKQNRALKQVLKCRGIDGSSALSESENEADTLVQILLKNRESKSILRAATNEDMVET